NSSASPLTQTVTSVATTTTLTSSDSNSFPTEPVTFTATVSAAEGGTPTGSVTFKIDGGSGTVVSLNGAGRAAFTASTLSPGKHTITANYTSDTNVFANSSASLQHVIPVAVITATIPNASEEGSTPGRFV